MGLNDPCRVTLGFFVGLGYIKRCSLLPHTSQRGAFYTSCVRVVEVMTQGKMIHVLLLVGLFCYSAGQSTPASTTWPTTATASTNVSPTPETGLPIVVALRVVIQSHEALNATTVQTSLGKIASLLSLGSDVQISVRSIQLV
ncbi:hypothetical protein AALO_G00017410 [Alosa alosa]|uniref:Uncharacterized protein n=1 Tax=Alosa alosa TaxID=278164 RepID=A0AAV6HHI4_9TELE|nr:hypothetical protein AALO_G00017410 [Alosa alosa]